MTFLEEHAGVAKQLSHVLSNIRSAEMLERDHGTVESWLFGEGTEFLRQVFQAHLDIRANEETPMESVVGADGVERNDCRPGCKRPLMTLFGEVTVRRCGYGKYGGQWLYPLDAKLNLPADKYSNGMRLRLIDEEVRSSFDDAVTCVQQTTGGKVPKRQAEMSAVDAAQDFEKFYESRTTDDESTADPLIMSVDGKGIVMRKEALREATRKAAENEQHKLKTRLSRGEKSNRKRMALAATIYTIERRTRTAEDIMVRRRDKPAETKSQPRPKNKRVWASVERDPHDVIDEVFQAALRRDPKQQRDWVMLVDGQKQQLNAILSSIEQYRAQATTLILDFIHVLEYLWKAAYCFHPEGSEAAEQWVHERALLILQGKSSNVAAGMRRSATLRQLAKKARKPVDVCAAYLINHRDMLRYDIFLAKGFPIATGVIEGACRHLIKDRLDITGARWGLNGAESILKLRSLRSSDDLDEYWKFHQLQSFERNHASHYANCPVTKAA
jgi:hypothetical protein